GPKRDCLVACANLYSLPIGQLFADLRGNLRDVIIRIFHCQLEQGPDWKCLSQNELVDLRYDHKIEAWLVKVRRVTFLPRFGVSLFPAWGNCFKAGCSWRLSSFAWPRSSGFSCWDGSSIFGPSSTLRSSSLPHRRTETPNKSSPEIRDAQFIWRRLRLK